MRECYLQTYISGNLILEVATNPPSEYKSRCHKNYKSMGMGKLISSYPCTLEGTLSKKPEINYANPTNFIRTRQVGKFVN